MSHSVPWNGGWLRECLKKEVVLMVGGGVWYGMLLPYSLQRERGREMLAEKLDK